MRADQWVDIDLISLLTGPKWTISANSEKKVWKAHGLNELYLRRKAAMDKVRRFGRRHRNWTICKKWRQGTKAWRPLTQRRQISYHLPLLTSRTRKKRPDHRPQGRIEPQGRRSARLTTPETRAGFYQMPNLSSSSLRILQPRALTWALRKEPASPTTSSAHIAQGNSIREPLIATSHFVKNKLLINNWKENWRIQALVRKVLHPRTNSMAHRSQSTMIFDHFWKIPESTKATWARAREWPLMCRHRENQISHQFRVQK